MKTDARELKRVMEDMIVEELVRLRKEADICVFALYDPLAKNDDPIDFYCVNRDSETDHPPPVSLNFDGIGVWYFAFRKGDTFRARKILLQVRNRRFVSSQVGDFDGYWDDFPNYVAEDRWVTTLTRHQEAANEVERLAS